MSGAYPRANPSWATGVNPARAVIKAAFETVIPNRQSQLGDTVQPSSDSRMWQCGANIEALGVRSRKTHL